MPYDIDDNRLKVPYVPVREPRERLTALHDENEWTVRLNPQFLALAVSALDIFAWPDSWQGSDAEIVSQIGEVLESQNALRTNVIMVKDVTMPDACTLRVTDDDDNTTDLDLSQCAGAVPAIRRNPITGDYEYWDGAEWQSMPSPTGAGAQTPDPNDPRFQGGNWETPEPGAGIDIVCRAADAMMKELQAAADELVDNVDWTNEVWQSGFTIASSFLSTVAGLFSAVATGNVAVGLGIGIAAYEYISTVAEEFLGLAAEYNLSEAEGLADTLNSNWTDMRCLLYCNLNSDGQLDYEGHLALLDDIDIEIGLGHSNSDWYEFIRPIVEMAGTDALNMAYGEYGSTEDDCTACACITLHEFLGGSGLNGAVVLQGTYNATHDRIDGECIRPVADHINSRVEMTFSSDIIRVEFDVEWHATDYSLGGWDNTAVNNPGAGDIDIGDKRAGSAQGARTVGAVFDTPTSGTVNVLHQSKSLTCQYYSRITAIRVWTRG